MFLASHLMHLSRVIVIGHLVAEKICCCIELIISVYLSCFITLYLLISWRM